MRRSRGSHAWRHVFAAGLCGALLLAGSPAEALDGGSILGGVLNALSNAIVTNSWQKLDPQVQDCLASQYNMNPADLAQQGILATDSRVTPYIQQCEQSIAQAQQQQQEEQQAAYEQQQQQEAQEQRLASLKSQSKELIAKYGRKRANQILEGNIDYGMNTDEVTLAWGSPSEVADDQPRPGETSWKYGNDIVVFKKGRVTAVTH